MSNHADRFEWAGGHPALDLVNTLDDRPSTLPLETLTTYRELVHFSELAGLIERPLAAKLRRFSNSRASDVVRRTRALREHLFTFLTASHRRQPARQTDVARFSSAIQAAHQARGLIKTRGENLAAYGWQRLEPDILLHACSLAIERLLVDADRRKIRKCGAFDCDVYYLDHSKGQRRQWCSMKACGNREKQRRRRSEASK
jgi:predicted RNA-binding Zn ribbon-like protein